MSQKEKAGSLYYRFEDMEGIELLSCVSTRPFTPHLHSRYNIWLNSTCGETFHSRGSATILQPDSFGIVPPGEVHANAPLDPSGRHLRSFYVDAALLRAIARQAGFKGASEPGFRHTVIDDREYRQKLSSLHMLLTRTEPELVLTHQTALIDVLAGLITRHGQALRKKAKAPAGKERIRQVVEYMGDNLSENISVEELADIGGCSPYHLIRSFRKEKGLPPHAYLVQLRIERAKDLIGKGVALSRAALEAGFSDQSHLTRIFRKSFGITPRTYARQVRG